jgi:sulfite reductase alpha subunit-like flavoprotein
MIEPPGAVLTWQPIVPPHIGSYTIAGAPQLVRGVVASNLRLTTPDWAQDVRSIRIAMPASYPAYNAGDVAVVYPRNSGLGNEALERLAGRVGLALDDCIAISPRGLSTADADLVLPPSDARVFPRMCSLRDVFDSYLDLRGIPRRGFFEQLSFFASDEEQRDKYVYAIVVTLLSASQYVF